MSGDSPLRIVLFSAAAPFVPFIEACVTERGHRLVGLVGSPGPRSRRTDDYLGVAQLARPNLDIVITNYPNRFAGMVRPMRPDLILCFGFNWKIPADVFDVPRRGAVNFHDSLLPRYRGRNAMGWVLRSDEPESGVTFHYMSADLDTGPILSQRRFAITDDDYSAAGFMPRFRQCIREALVDALDRVVAGDPGTPQDESRATYAGGAFEPEWREIDWTDMARHNFVKIRSWYGARDVPRGAFGEIDGERHLILASRLPDSVDGSDADPGTLLDRRDDGTLLIQCGDGPLEILEWQPAETAAVN